jgi:ATP-dependent Lon protease
MSEIVSVFKDIAQLNPLFRDQFSTNQVAANVIDEPDKLADFARLAKLVSCRMCWRVSLWTIGCVRHFSYSKKELINAQLQSKLSRDLDSKIAKRQREYYLME